MTRLPAGVRHVRCDNPGPMTLTGTNTYVVDVSEEAGAPEIVVIDPGPELVPDHGAHLDAIVAAARAARTSGCIHVLLTHHHNDHAGAVADVIGALRGAGLEVRVYGAGHAALPERIGRLETLRTPGHTKDSAVFFLRSGARGSQADPRPDEPPVLFSGDTLLGGSSSFVAYPDGDLTQYLESLDELAALLAAMGPTRLAPGHGEVGLDALTVVENYRAHRRERLEQVRRVLDELGPTAGVDDVVAAVYADIGPELRPAVEAIVQAQVQHLRGVGD